MTDEKYQQFREYLEEEKYREAGEMIRNNTILFDRISRDDLFKLNNGLLKLIDEIENFDLNLHAIKPKEEYLLEVKKITKIN